MPGTMLIREHHGRHHHVIVAEGDFVWVGKTYPSLSKVACAITGTKWNGPTHCTKPSKNLIIGAVAFADKKRGKVSQGKASVVRRASQFAVGFAATPTQTMFRRATPNTINANRRSKRRVRSFSPLI